MAAKPFLYIHIPKTAGQSVSKSGIVLPEHWQGHSRASQIANLDQFYSFCFIRNPYDRLFSAWNFHKNFKGHVNQKTRNAVVKLKTFKAFVHSLDKFNPVDSRENGKLHFMYSQYDYLTKDGELLVDYVGDFYNMVKGFEKVQILNPYHDKKLTMGVVNATPHSPWQEHYTDELAKLVYNHWKIDFEYFKFDREIK